MSTEPDEDDVRVTRERVVLALARALSDVDPPRVQHLWLAEELLQVALENGAWRLGP